MKKRHKDKVITEDLTSTILSEIILQACGWKIRIQPYRDIHNLRRSGCQKQKIVLTGVGEISREDDTQIRTKDVEPILEAISYFLSFAFAEWSPPLLAVGSNDVAQKSCQFWASYDLKHKPYPKGWLGAFQGTFLSEAFPGFMSLWMNEQWREALKLSIYWLIETSRHTGGTESAIAIGQIPLEMLAWLMFVEESNIIQSGEFDKLSAATKIQLLLSHCNIPFEVPPELETLNKVIDKF